MFSVCSLLERQLSNTTTINTVKRRILIDPEEIQTKIEKLPFFVERTKYGNSLPIYTEYRNNRQRITTLIRRIYGNIHKLSQSLEQVLPQGSKIVVREEMRQISIKGNHQSLVKEHFLNLGF